MNGPTSKQARILWFSATLIAVGVALAFLGALVWAFGWLLHLLSPVVWPLAIAAVLAYLLDPVVDLLERKRVPRGRAILLVFLTATLLGLGVMGNILPRLIFETRDLIVRVPAYADQVQTRAQTWLEQSRWVPTQIRNALPPMGTNAPAARTNIVVATPPVPNGEPAPVGDPQWVQRASEWLVGWVTSALPEIGSWLLQQMARVASWAGLLIGLFLVPIYAYYFLKEKLGIQKGWTDYLPVQDSRFKEELIFVLTAINDYLIVFFRGQVVVAAVDAVLYTIGFFAIGLPYALLLGLIAGALSIVPFLGAILTIIPAVVLAAVSHQDWLHPVLAVVVFTVVQTIEGFVVSPKVMGDRVGLHPLTIIVAVLVGTTLLGGILGGVLAIPLTAALKVLMDRYVWKRHIVTAPMPL